MRVGRRVFLGSAAAGFVPRAGATSANRLEQAVEPIRLAAGRGEVREAAIHASRGPSVFERGFGAGTPPDRIFLIASITKPMTAAGVMVLADRGELKLDDPVRRFIPEFAAGDRGLVTVRHLLTHTSGLPDQLPENVELRRRHAPLEEFVAHTIRTPLLFKPGTRVFYQSMGILLAAEAARRITGEPFPRFLEGQVFGPLGMTRTALGLGRFSIPETAQCQVETAPGLYGGGAGDAASWNWNSPYWRNLAAPWGGAHSTAPDIARFLRYFLEPDGRVVKPETAAAMVVDQTAGLNEPRGIGFVVKRGSFGRACSGRAFGHSGATGTIGWADPATGLVCVILTTLPLERSSGLVLKPVSDLVSEAFET
jgi:CubicO group peptidase (beta-lactamase class C family)